MPAIDRKCFDCKQTTSHGLVLRVYACQWNWACTAFEHVERKTEEVVFSRRSWLSCIVGVRSELVRSYDRPPASPSGAIFHFKIGTAALIFLLFHLCFFFFATQASCSFCFFVVTSLPGGCVCISDTPNIRNSIVGTLLYRILSCRQGLLWAAGEALEPVKEQHLLSRLPLVDSNLGDVALFAFDHHVRTLAAVYVFHARLAIT